MDDISVIVFDNDYDPTSSWHRCVGRHSDLGRLVLPSQQQASNSFFRHDLTCASKVTLGYTFKYVYFFSKWHAQYKGLHLSITPHELNAHSTIKHSTLVRRLQNYYEITNYYTSPPPPHGATAQVLVIIEASQSQTHHTGMTSLDEWSARRRDLYRTAYNTHKRHRSMLRRGSNPQSQQASGRRPTP